MAKHKKSKSSGGGRKGRKHNNTSGGGFLNSNTGRALKAGIGMAVVIGAGAGIAAAMNTEPGWKRGLVYGAVGLIGAAGAKMILKGKTGNAIAAPLVTAGIAMAAVEVAHNQVNALAGKTADLVAGTTGARVNIGIADTRGMPSGTRPAPNFTAPPAGTPGTGSYAPPPPAGTPGTGSYAPPPPAAQVVTVQAPAQNAPWWQGLASGLVQAAPGLITAISGAARPAPVAAGGINSWGVPVGANGINAWGVPVGAGYAAQYGGNAFAMDPMEAVGRHMGGR